MKKLIPLIFALALLADCGAEPAAYYLAEPFGEQGAALLTLSADGNAVYLRRKRRGLQDRVLEFGGLSAAPPAKGG